MVFHFRKRLLLLFGLVACSILQAQNPNGYYDAANGTKGKTLKTALYQIISDHTARSYSQLWEDFKKTDVREDGKIWDMYSNITSYTPGGSEQGRNYSDEGDSYNREHSFPKSWFNDAKPMYTDLFHLYPTDGYVNNRRSNYPFGETDGETYQSSGGFSKLGKSTVSGYSGTVFEPADEYKGDFARTYFYMATAYENQIASWDSPMLSGNSYPAYADWALTMLLRWAAEDPVSEKERARNEAVYKIQKNRNPYIDYPGLEQYVWGSRTSQAFDPNHYSESGGEEPNPQPNTVAAPTFNPAPGLVTEGTVVTISSATPGAYICYSLNEGTAQTAAAPVTFTVTETVSVRAYAVLDDAISSTVNAVYTVEGRGDAGTHTYVLVTDDSKLTPGSEVLIVCPSQYTVMASQGKDIRNYVSLEETDISECITTETGTDDLPYAFVLGKAEGNWTFFSPAEQVWLALLKSDNKLHTSTDAASAQAQWTIDISSGGTALITNVYHAPRAIKYNPSAPRFACYSNGQSAVALYQYATPTLIDRLESEHTGTVDVFTLDGRLLRHASTFTDALKRLPKGNYVVGGRKVIIK